jgi:4-diphosphocytidyl-2-C-methyl-D-erythritol kinase
VHRLSLFAPAKLNLFLAVTGRRADGFHDLVSLVVHLDLGDRLHIEAEAEVTPAGAEFSLRCDDPAVPGDGTNLVLKAAHAFSAAAGWTGRARFLLEKRTPLGAGLGGGSSDAVAALLGLNRLAGEPLQHAELAGLAAQLGSDCPLFLYDTPVVIRGRGERVERVSDLVAARLRGRRVLVFKPAFGIPTSWAYARLAAEAPGSYLPEMEAEGRLGAWLAEADAPAEHVLVNTLERAAFQKYLALPVLLERLRERFGLEPRMSGSGSACFAFLQDDVPAGEVAEVVRTAWGASAFVTEARVG